MSLWDTEVPVAYSAWAAVWTLAAAIKREAWVRWGMEDPMFPRFYIILSGKAANLKGVAIGRADKVYRKAIGPIRPLRRGELKLPYDGKLSEEWIKALKTHVPVAYDRATTRGLMGLMDIRARNKYGSFQGPSTDLYITYNGEQVYLENGKPQILHYQKTSEVAVIAEELQTFLGKAQYNEGLTGQLLSIYNTKDVHEDTTGQYGYVRMERLCTNLLAGTTPMSFQNSVSPTAKDDGFLSRLTIVHQDRRFQRFSRPRRYEVLPKIDDLAYRLAYLTETTFGEHRLTPEAEKVHDRWYDRFCDRLEDFTERSGLYNRTNVQLIELTLLMKAQRYPEAETFDITVEDFEDARRLLEGTLNFAPGIFARNEDTPAKTKELERAARIIRRRKDLGITRPDFMGSSRFNAAQATAVVNDLIRFGKVEVWKGQKLQPYATTATSELYKWIGNGYGEEEKE